MRHRAKENGSTRFCMGAAWKGVRDGDRKFEQMLETIRAVSKLGMEVCVTLGQLSDTEARKAKGGWRHRLQSQYRHLARHYPQNRHHPYLRRSPEYHCRRATRRNERLLRRNHRHGRNRRGSPAHARSALFIRPAAGERSHQLPRSDAGNPSRALRTGRYFRARPAHSHHAHRFAEGKGAPVGGSQPPLARSPGTLLLCRRELDLLRRQTSHRVQSLLGRGQGSPSRTLDLQPQAPFSNHPQPV